MINNLLYDEKTGKLEKYKKEEWEEKFEQLGYDIPEDRNYEMEFYKNANNIICFNIHGEIYKRAEMNLESTVYDNFTREELIAINNLFKKFGCFKKRQEELANSLNCSGKQPAQKKKKKHKNNQTSGDYEKRNYQNLQMINLDEYPTKLHMEGCFEGALKEAIKLYEQNQMKRLKAIDFEKELKTNDYHLDDAEDYNVKKVATFVWQCTDGYDNKGEDIFRAYYKGNPTDMVFSCEWTNSFSEEEFETKYECLCVDTIEDNGDMKSYLEYLKRSRKKEYDSVQKDFVQGEKNVQKLERCKKCFKRLGYKVEKNTDVQLTFCKDNYNVIHFYKDVGEFYKTGKWNCDYDPITIDELIAINILFSAYGFFF